jgi:hypothetical protein
MLGRVVDIVNGGQKLLFSLNTQYNMFNQYFLSLHNKNHCYNISFSETYHCIYVNF